MHVTIRCPKCRRWIPGFPSCDGEYFDIECHHCGRCGKVKVEDAKRK